MLDLTNLTSENVLHCRRRCYVLDLTNHTSENVYYLGIRNQRNEFNQTNALSQQCDFPLLLERLRKLGVEIKFEHRQQLRAEHDGGYVQPSLPG